MTKKRQDKMKQIGDMKSYSLDEITDELIGKKGSTERNKFDMEVEESVRAYFKSSNQRPLE